MVSANVDYTTMQIAAFYQKTTSDLSKTLLRLSTGKRFQNPADDAVNYIRSQNFQQKVDTYKTVNETIALWQEGINQAGTVVGQVYDNLNRMKELISLATNSVVAADKTNYQTEFNALATANSKMVTGTTYMGKSILNSAVAIATITVDPDAAAPTTLALNPGLAVTAAALSGAANAATDDISDVAKIAQATTDVDTAITDIGAYLGKNTAYKSILSSYNNWTDSVVTNAQSAMSTINSINDAEEIATYTAQEIRQQASMAMLSQANMAKRNVLMLFGMSTR